MSDPIGRLRRMASATAGPAPDDWRWLTNRLKEYLDGAAAGLSLERAMDLATSPGGRPWWSSERLDQRDEALRMLAQQHLADLSVGGQVAAIIRMRARYEATMWKADRLSASPPGGPDSQRRLLWMVLGCGRIPGARRLRMILEAKRRGTSI